MTRAGNRCFVGGKVCENCSKNASLTLPCKYEFHLVYSCSPGGPDFVQNTDHLRRWLNRVWIVVIRWEHSSAIHQQLLVVLLEWILPHLDKPLLLTDYLMDSLDMGKQYHLEYYGRQRHMYTPLQTEITGSKTLTVTSVAHALASH